MGTDGGWVVSAGLGDLWAPETGVLPFLIGASLAMMGVYVITSAWRERQQRFVLNAGFGETRRVRYSIARIALWNRLSVVGIIGIVHTLYVLLF